MAVNHPYFAQANVNAPTQFCIRYQSHISLPPRDVSTEDAPLSLSAKAAPLSLSAKAAPLSHSARRVVLLTNDRANKEKAVAEGIEALTMKVGRLSLDPSLFLLLTSPVMKKRQGRLHAYTVYTA